MAAPAYAPASVRNSEPILGVLRTEIGECRRLLEIGSGTGYHAVTFGRALPNLNWQTSDLPENHDTINAAVRDSGLLNVLEPIPLDVLDPGPIVLADDSVDAVYSSNTAHIMSFDAVRSMIALVGRVLRHGGRFLLYGPFRRAGQFSTPSNAAFDESLRTRDAAMGIRDLEAMDRLAAKVSLRCLHTYAMPANNLLVVWQRQEDGE